ncbi:hypothetical protein QFC20_004373 [Naganishia adeliensis]|uniref:Uncharacterized protein n=1 Tax=Naganishia adeliensis TaxID=92952 RepID=A0ACC2W1W2_9TREE|nr:hypothetical protein QFC20_004373 [Naganishia adeliensis]
MQETPTRLTRAAVGSTGSGRINYNQTQIINSPGTFTPPLQSRNSQPNVPSRLRQSTGTPQPIPSVLQRSANMSQYRTGAGSGAPLPKFPETYPAGPLPINAYPPGQPRSQRYPQRPHTQAKYTTYDSRMKTGVSGLVQPIHVTGGPNEAFTPSSVFNSGNAPLNTGTMTPEYGRGGRSRRGKINYAEVEDDDFGDEDERNEKQEKKMVDDAKVQEGWSWLGERTPGNRVRSRLAPPATASLPFVPEDDLEREAQKPVLLAPIRVELDTETHRIRDYFTWNVNETLISPEEFATTFCRDLNIPSYYRDQIATMIRQQTEEYAELLLIDAMDEWDNDLDAEDAADEEEQASAGKEKVNKDKEQSGKEALPEEEDQDMEADCRVIVNLDVQIFTFNLRDRIEWDLCSHLTPEQFTEAYCAEIGLTGEAKPIIAHAIHEELLKHKKDAYEAKLYGPGALQMEERKNAPMKLKEVWRDWNEKEEFGPAMIPLRMDELIQKEQERDRAARRMRRETSRFQNPTGRRSRW